MKIARMLRNPFALIGQGFLLGGLMFVAFEGAHADTAKASPPRSEIAPR